MGLEPQSPASGTAVWFVKAGGKVWGPYPEARIEAFVSEGRVAAETLMAPGSGGPFLPAARQARLYRLFGDVELASDEGLDEPPAPDPQTRTAQTPTARAPAAQTLSPVRPLLVWAALKSRRPERFEELLGVHGAFVRVGPGLWLVRARLSPAGLRNVMTRRLEGDDRLMVVDAPQDHAAWFNIDGDTDRTLRHLWSGEG